MNYYPYKPKVRQELLEGDNYDRRAIFCGWLLDKNIRFINNLIVTDEAAFHMNGMVNRQTVRTYSPYKQNPMNVFKKPISREKVSVWMGLSGSGHIIGPFFYEGNLNGNAYLQMLIEKIIPRLFELYGDRVDHLWWMQDGAPCHRTNVVRNRLREVFGNRIIGLGHAVEWPPSSPDLTPCDFFFLRLFEKQSL